MPHRRLLLRGRPDAPGAQFRPAHRHLGRHSDLHALCRLDDRPPHRHQRGYRAILAAMGPCRDRGRGLHVRTVRRGQCARPQACRRQGWAASGLAYLRDVRIRLSHGLRRPADCRAAGSRHRGAVSLRAETLHGKPGLSGRCIRLTAMSRVNPRQLELALGHAESFARKYCLSGPSNAAARATIERWPDWPAQAMVLVGPEGCGKSHLAAIWAGAAGARFLAARAVVVEGLPGALATGALVVEDIAPEALDERALFHLLNLAREERAFVLFTARTAPSGWTIGLRDLASRLRAVPVVPPGPPDDALLRAVLVKLFGDRQLAADESLIGYLAKRIERSVAAARAIVAEVHREGM